MTEQRDRTFSILKALAILLVVTAHATAPTYVSRFAYMVSVPAFFVCAGYFFRPDYLECKSTFVVRRVRRLYFPFVKWSILFLLLHNLLFPLGLLSETYGNAAGGVTHPYDWHTAMQNLWSIVFNMSGYDVFLAGVLGWLGAVPAAVVRKVASASVWTTTALITCGPLIGSTLAPPARWKWTTLLP